MSTNVRKETNKKIFIILGILFLIVLVLSIVYYQTKTPVVETPMVGVATGMTGVATGMTGTTVGRDNIGMALGPFYNVSTTASATGTTGTTARTLVSTDESGNLTNSGLTPQSFMPNICLPGMISVWAGTTAPANWVLCDGSEYSTEDDRYKNLYAVIANTYGTASKDKHFKVPDLRGRVPVGFGQGTGLTNRTLNATGGAEEVTLSPGQMPIHSHGIKVVGVENDKGKDICNDVGGYVGGGPGSGRFVATDRVGGGNNMQYTHEFGQDNNGSAHPMIHNTGGNQPHSNMPPFIVINYIIKL